MPNVAHDQRTFDPIVGNYFGSPTVRMWDRSVRIHARRCGLPANSSAAGPRDDVSWSRRNRSYPTFDEACELCDNRVRDAFPSQSAC